MAHSRKTLYNLAMPIRQWTPVRYALGFKNEIPENVPSFMDFKWDDSFNVSDRYMNIHLRIIAIAKLCAKRTHSTS